MLEWIWSWAKWPVIIAGGIIGLLILLSIIPSRSATNALTEAEAKQEQIRQKRRAKYKATAAATTTKITRLTEGKFLEEAKEAFVAFDFETTGLSPESDEIIEVGAVRYINGCYHDSFSELVNPQKRIPTAATKIHGITNDMVEDCRSIDEVLPDFLDFISGDPIVAHNASFDISFLSAALDRTGITAKIRYHDSLSLARKHYPDLENHKLGTVADHIGCHIDQAHRSEADCEAVGDIVKDILESCA